jgi:hypothetical protein
MASVSQTMIQTVLRNEAKAMTMLRHYEVKLTQRSDIMEITGC